MSITKIPAVKGYGILEPIGQGAYGIVYRARQPFVDREVALKVILPEYANQPEFIRRFETEAQLVAQLEHLHIVPLYDYWRDPQGAFLVMRLMQGGNLAELLLEGPMELTRAAQLIDQVASALQVAHQQGVVHRDLKPANILFDDAGNAYLSDFGIAKTITSQTDLTATGAILGTPAYVSPEQVQSQPVSPQTDIYSLGILLFEILTGQHPFPGSASGVLLVKQVNDPLPLVQPLRPELPQDVDQIIQRATAKNPAERYADTLTLAQDLRRALNLEITTPITLEGELVNPYKGLRAFQEVDADDFFGREALVEDLIARLREAGAYSRFLAVVGPSGSGKSSVVKAGLIPALRKGGLPGSENWFITEMVPGSHPLEELELALLRVAVHQPPSLLSQIKEDTRGLLRAARRVLPAGAQLLLVVDQLEEAFTLVQDPEVTNFFLQSLYETTFDPRSPVRIIVTLRADFYDRPLMHPDFSRLIQKRTEVVVPLTSEELQLAVRKPAERVGALLDKELLPTIVSDVIHQPGALPLLQYALREMFERRSGRMITCQAYQEIGGVTGALGRQAEEIFSQLEDKSQDAARQLFLRLVSLGEGEEDTRRRVLISELLSLESRHIDGVIEIFGKARLLTFDHHPTNREPTLEVSHEALLKEWSRLQTWLDESRADVRLQRLLANAAAEWLGAENDPGFLLRGSRLVQFEGWLETSSISLTTAEHSFLEASFEARQSREIADQERRKRELEQVSIGLAAQAIRELDGASPERSVLLALEALENYPYTWQAENALGTAVLKNRHRMVLNHGDEVITADWSPDGSRILTGSKEGIVRLWDAASGEELWKFKHGEPDRSFWSPDGRSFLLVNERDASITVWDNESFKPRFTLELEELMGILFIGIPFFPWSPCSSKFVLASSVGKVFIFDSSTGSLLDTLSNHEGIVAIPRWSPDGKYIITAGYEDGKVSVWDAASYELCYEFDAGFEDKRTLPASWSPSGDQFTIRGLGGGKIINLDSGEEILSIKIPKVYWQSFCWSPDGTILLSTGKEDGTVRFWDAASGEEISKIEGLVQAYGSDWSPCGEYAAIACADGNVHVWHKTTRRQIESIKITRGFVVRVKFSPDGRQILVFGGDHQVKIVNMSTARIVHHFKSHGTVTNVFWSPDGSEFAFGILVPPDYPMNIYDAETGEVLQTISAPDIYGGILWSPGGDRILTSNAQASIYDAKTGEKVISFQVTDDEDYWDYWEDWSPDGRYIATALENGEIHIWESTTGENLFQYPIHSNSVLSLEWSPDGSRILSTSENGEATISDPHSGEIILQLLPEDYRNIVPAARWSHDSSRAFVITAEGDVMTFASESGDLISKFSTSPVSLITFISISPSEKRILISGHDGAVKVWDMQQGVQLLSYELGGFATGDYSPDGKHILIGTTEGSFGSLQVFPTWHSTQELIDYARQHQVFRQLTQEERVRFGLPVQQE